MFNVKITHYYSENKKHNIGLINFMGSARETIESERVFLMEDNTKLYFVPATKEDKGSIVYNNHKLQLWKLADVAEKWQGEYSIRYDSGTGYYFINKDEVKEGSEDVSPRWSSKVPRKNYTPHSKDGASAHKKLTIQEICDANLKKLEQDKKRIEVIDYVKDLISSLIDSHKFDEASQLCKSLEILTNN